jgi:hypothetical protein
MLGSRYQPSVAIEAAANSSWSFTAAKDFVAGQSSLYHGLQGTVTHQRGLLYTKTSQAGLPAYIVVVDRVSSDRPRTVQASWHAHPNSAVAFVNGRNGSLAATVQGVDTGTSHPADTMVTIVPSVVAAADGTGFSWDNASVVRGQKGNASLGIPWQGWYSDNYNGNATAPTLVVSACHPPA